MSPRPAAWLARVIVLLCLALLVVSQALKLLNGADAGVPSFAEWDTLVFPIVGSLIVSRQPANPIGWLMCALGFSFGVIVVTHEYAVHALIAAPGSLPLGVWIAWLGQLMWAPALALLMLLLALFPDGQPPSRRWRSLIWLIGGWTSVVMIVSVITPGPFSDIAELRSFENPMGIAAAGWLLHPLQFAALAFFLVPLFAALAALLLRFRHARGLERQQLKWVAYAGALTIVVLAVSSPALHGLVPGEFRPLFEGLEIVAGLAIPAAIGIAILRHHLYDIDVLINRTLVYGALTAALALVYFGSVVLLQAAFRAVTGQTSELAIIISTLAIAALFQPLRNGLQAFIDRRFYRRKYDAARTLTAFSARLRDEVDLPTLRDELVGVARETMQPTAVLLWLNPPGRLASAPTEPAWQQADPTPR